MKLVLVVFDGVQALDVAGPLDAFAAANALLPAHQHYEVSLVGIKPGNVRCSNGLEIFVPYDYLSYPGDCDLLLVAGGPHMPEARPDPAFLSWLRHQADNSRRFGSVCNGAFLLGHAGLLDGHEVTAHWSSTRRLAEQFPDASVRPDTLFIREGRLFTSAGVSAGIDLCLSLIAEDWGRELSVEVAKQLVVYIHREGAQSQCSPFLAAHPDEDSMVATVLRFVIEHIDEAFSMDQLADAVSVSRRTFSRVFAKHANVTPSVFVEQVRVDFARRLLEEMDAPLKTVAFKCGFHSATHMRLIFSRRLGLTPNEYRQRLRGSHGTVELAADIALAQSRQNLRAIDLITIPAAA